MKSTDKAAWLLALEHQVEGYIQRAVECFQNMDEVILSKPSQSGGWSIVQCLEHVNSYGHYYLPHLTKGLITQQNKPPTNHFKSFWLGTFLTRLMDPGTGKRKFKAVKRHQPTGALLAHKVVAEFIDQQEQLLLLLRQAADVDVNDVHIPVSVAPWMHLPVGDVLQFLVAHTERHIAQANRNLLLV
ncbi:DinB family protein [Spirosoma knui]